MHIIHVVPFKKVKSHSTSENGKVMWVTYIHFNHMPMYNIYMNVIFISFQNKMDLYIQLIFRSHLEKAPDKYVMPNADKAVRDTSELTVLKPKVIGLDVHEYPNEHVIVLQGDNLWFSYKICFEEKGEKDESHEIDTPAENTTKAMIEFHIPDTHKAYYNLSSQKKVKLALYTHFAKPIRQTVDIRKVNDIAINECIILHTAICRNHMHSQ